MRAKVANWPGGHNCNSRQVTQQLRAAGHDVCIASEAEETVRLLRLHTVEAVVLDYGCAAQAVSIR